MPKNLKWLWARGVYYPTLGWNMLLGRLTKIRKWWHRVDDHLILGARPFASDIPKLVKENVTGIINTCEEFCGPIGLYNKHGIEQLYIPTIDFTPPSLDDVNAAINFIEQHAARGSTVYVHCKAGRGRSATIALCWLIKRHGLTPSEAQSKLTKIRPHIKKHLDRRNVVSEFYQLQQAISAGNPASESPSP